MELNLSPHIKLKELPFTQDILDMGGMVYVVGGVVRDFYLNKASKDLDILVVNINLNDLDIILSKYGRVDNVGISFGIIKFKPFNSDPKEEPIDIAIPRKDTKHGTGHLDFTITSDPFLPIEEDLRRRDLRINSIAMDVNGNIVDPFNGINDINNKVLNVTDETTFFEDPLRLLRIVQFASRFEFTIEPKTLELIKNNAHQLGSITAERILIELTKIVDKGNPRLGAELLIETKLYEVIFNTEFKNNLDSFNNIKSLGNFIFQLLKGNSHIRIGHFFKNDLSGDIETTKEIVAYEKLNDYLNVTTELGRKLNFYEAINISKKILELGQVSEEYLHIFNDFKNGKYPCSYKDLAINGNDLKTLGFEGTEIGRKLRSALIKVLDDSSMNNKDFLIKYSKPYTIEQYNGGE